MRDGATDRGLLASGTGHATVGRAHWTKGATTPMSCQVTLSHFTAPPWMGSGIGTWQHHAVLGTRIYVAITYLTYAGEDVTVVTCDGVPMQKHHVSEDAFGQFHTLEVFSALAIGTGPVTIQTSFNVFPAAPGNIAKGRAAG